MRKKSSLAFFEMNPFVLFCVIYVITITINGVILGTLSNVQYISILHLLDNAILCGVPFLVFTLFRNVPFLKRFDGDDCSPWISVPVHYIISCLLLLVIYFTFAIIRSIPAVASDYLGLLGMYTRGYVIVVLLAVTVQVYKVEKVNKNLKKIQESLNNTQ